MCSAIAKRLRHGSLLREGLAGVLQARGVVYQQPGGLKLRGHLGKLELHALELGNGFAKLPTLLGIGNRGLQGPLGQTHHLRANPCPFQADRSSCVDLPSTLCLGTIQF
jgi:hypothetical protein